MLGDEVTLQGNGVTPSCPMGAVVTLLVLANDIWTRHE